MANILAGHRRAVPALLRLAYSTFGSAKSHSALHLHAITLALAFRLRLDAGDSTGGW